ncbi:MAG: TOBE domain-containing protein [Thaumarchaeota archaeon]|nr:TOBE domain-containing protein [Nitrososphaerota archaeon]
MDGSGASIDPVDALILHAIDDKKSISGAAKGIGISYRNAWDRLKSIQSSLGRNVVTAQVGGKIGGGARLTPEGKALIAEYRRMNAYLFNALQDRDYWQHIGYRLSARNRLKAKVVEVQRGPIASEVKMSLGTSGVLTSIISNEAVEELGLKAGDRVEAIIKATEVIIAKQTGRS